jgi:2-iminobutanoate/2-iminopropanoate deaminase
MRRIVPLVLLLSASSLGAQAGKNDVEFKARPNAVGPFSEAVRVGNLLFLSGVLGTDSANNVVPGGIKAETKQALENIKAALKRNGLDMDRVVKCTVFLADIAEWPAMNEVYTTYFPVNKPARSALGGVQLVRQGRLEIECIAAMR